MIPFKYTFVRRACKVSRLAESSSYTQIGTDVVIITCLSSCIYLILNNFFLSVNNYISMQIFFQMSCQHDSWFSFSLLVLLLKGPSLKLFLDGLLATCHPLTVLLLIWEQQWTFLLWFKFQEHKIKGGHEHKWDHSEWFQSDDLVIPSVNLPEVYEPWLLHSNLCSCCRRTHFSKMSFTSVNRVKTFNWRKVRLQIQVFCTR